MKKLNYLLLGAAALLMASCSQEDLQNNSVANGEGNVTFKVTIPKNITTRTIGDGKSATQLQVVVFDAPADGSLTYVLDADAEFDPISNTANVNLNLVTGKNYQIAFFAASEEALAGADDAVYSIDTTTGTLNVNYSAMTSDNNNDDAYDCFSANYTTGKISGAINETITLYRPVAQINWGTTGLTANSTGSNYEDIFGTDGQYMLSTLKANLYQSLNLLTGVCSNEAPVTLFDFAAPSATQGTFPTIGTSSYNYVAMQYILAPSTSSIVDLTLTISNAGEGNQAEPFTNDIVVTSAPVQANFQTNIYGNLLTGNVSFNVETSSEWDGSNVIDLTTWDGSTVTYPSIPTDNETPVMINRASDLAGLANMVNGKAKNPDGTTMEPQTFEGLTISLAADFDMGGNELQIGSATRASGNLASGAYSFMGVFDGQDHTISNVTISGTDNKDDAVGIFASVSGSTAEIKNLTVSGLNIDAPTNEQASVVGILNNGASVSNVTVTSGNISSSEGAAGIVGRVLGSGSVTGCENYASINTTTGSSGGIVGAATYTNENGISISGCTNHGDVTSTTTGTNASIGGIVGVSGAVVENCINNGNVTTKANNVGGIVAYQNSCGGVKNCQNYGTISGNQYVGGIVGWVGGIKYTLLEPIQITGNTNYGSLVANVSAGGIMTINRSTVYFSGNTNSAPSIKSGGSAAGLICGDTTVNTNSPSQGDNGYINYGADNVNNTLAEDIIGTKTNETFLGTVWMESEDKAVTQ